MERYHLYGTERLVRHQHCHALTADTTTVARPCCQFHATVTYYFEIRTINRLLSQTGVGAGC